MNTAAIMLCKDNISGAKEQIEILLEKLEMKVIVNNHESKSILPPFLVNILVYLLLKTSKFLSIQQLSTFFRELQSCQELG